MDASSASPSARLCLRFVVLTAAESGEARGATWEELHLDAREWRLLGGRTKAGMEHRVPLSDAAFAVLDRHARSGTAAVRYNAEPFSGLTEVAATSPLGDGPAQPRSLDRHLPRPKPRVQPCPLGWRPIAQ